MSRTFTNLLTHLVFSTKDREPWIRSEMKIELHAYDFLRERKIQGSSMGSNRFRVDMPRLLNAWKKGHLKLDHLITSHIKLDDINEGYAKLKEGNVLRQLVDFGVGT